jgi:Family of unknown function (DUF6173)
MYNQDFLNRLPSTNLPNLSPQPIIKREVPISEARREKETTDLGYAHVIYERLREQIREFEKTLKDDEEIAAYLASFGQNILIQIEDVGYHNPFLIVFHGFDLNNGQRVQLIQHTTQLNVLFTSYKLSPEENRPARRIGFCPEEKGS